MTTQDEVLRLAKAAGLVIHNSGNISPDGNFCTDAVSKLIDLAKAEAYEDATKILQDYLCNNPRPS